MFLPSRLTSVGPENVVNPSTFLGSNGRALSLQHPACRIEFEGWRIIHHRQGLRDGFRLGSDVWVAPAHFLPDLALVKTKDSNRCQVLTGAVQGTEHFTCILDNESYVQISIEVGIA